MTDAAASQGRSPRPPIEPERPTGSRVARARWGRLLFELVRLLPKNAVSRLAGRMAALPLPGPLQRAEIRLFAWLTRVDLDEARDPVDEFASLQEFFTRALRDGARPIEGGDRDLVSPCDGAWGTSGRIADGTLLQVKGRSYLVEALLGDADLARIYEGGTFATFYLSPRDYHRFHTPTAGRIARVDYWPGALWPVNAIGLEGVDGLFAVNERLCAFLSVDRETNAGSQNAPIALVAVGATMVGSVRLTFDDLRTNVRGATAARREYAARAPRFARGEQWGHFEFGSTIVMLVPPARFELDLEPAGRPVRLGQVIGRRIG